MLKAFIIILLSLVALAARAAEYPTPVQGKVVLRDFHFASGETLAELRIHYRTLGKPRRDGNGNVSNAVLITHGTGGAGTQFLRPEFAGELFGAGGLLDASRYCQTPADMAATPLPFYGNLICNACWPKARNKGEKMHRLSLLLTLDRFEPNAQQHVTCLS